MSADDRQLRRVLRWYPPRWRRRYGQELIDLLTDTYGERTPPLRCRLGLVRSGATEWCRELGLSGSTSSPSKRIRAGSLVVLWAWAVTLVAGAEFANVSEGWRRAMPAAGRGLPTAAYALVLVAAAGGAVVVLAGVALWARPLARFLGDGGWTTLRWHVVRSGVLTALMACLFVGMWVWSRHLSQHQRDGGYLPYGLLAVALGLAGAATVFSWTAAATAIVRRIDPAGDVVRRAGRLAIVLAGLMVVLAAGTAVWWAAVASRAPWFFDGTPTGTNGGVAPPLLILADLAIALAAAAAAAGARRVAACLPRQS